MTVKPHADLAVNDFYVLKTGVAELDVSMITRPSWAHDLFVTMHTVKDSKNRMRLSCKRDLEGQMMGEKKQVRPDWTEYFLDIAKAVGCRASHAFFVAGCCAMPSRRRLSAMKSTAE